MIIDNSIREKIPPCNVMQKEFEDSLKALHLGNELIYNYL